MLILYVMAIVTWGWMASQAARVPVLQRRVGELTREAARLDTLTARLSELQDRYDQVQRMLGVAAKERGSTEGARAKVAPAGKDTASKAVVPTAR